MALFPGNKLVVLVPGTLIFAPTSLSAQVQSRRHIAAHGVMFQALPSNVGRVYIGAPTMNRVARTGLFAMLPAPSGSTDAVKSMPTYSVALTAAPNALGIEEFYIDADNANDGVIYSYLVL